jgi:hypothetical protein
MGKVMGGSRGRLGNGEREEWVKGAGGEGLKVGKAGGEREMGKVLDGQSRKIVKGGSRGRLGNGEQDGNG